MTKKKNYIPIIGLIISVVILLFGNNILERIYAKIDTKTEKNKLSREQVTIAQVEVDFLTLFRIFVFKELVEEFHAKKPKYHLHHYSKGDTNWVENGKDRYRFMEVSLNPVYGSEPISKYSYYFTTDEKYMPLSAEVRDHIMLEAMSFAKKDSLIAMIPELDILDNVKDTIIITGVYTGVSMFRYGEDVGSLYHEFRYNSKGELREHVYEFAPD